MSYRKKLIEVALPLEAINKESAREKSIRHGHPSTLHLWWARRPLAACRAVLFASIVDDPSSLPEEFPTVEAQDAERERLFRIIEQLVLWENSTNEGVLDAARAEIMKATDGNPPPVLDPFCGGGSIPLEAQRLGLEAHGSDLNPVAVLITKALIEIPPKFTGRPPVNPEAKGKLAQSGTWRGAQGLAEDIRYYGRWMRDEAEKRIGHLYPKVQLPPEHGGGEATVIAWLWARTVICPNPACGARMPLVRSFALSTKPGRRALFEPIVDKAAKTVRFEVRTGDGLPQEGTKLRGKSRCLFCSADNIPDSVLRQQAKAFGIQVEPLAVVAEGHGGRMYLSPQEELITPEISFPTPWLSQALPGNARWFSPPGYGLMNYRDLFTRRQLVALTTFSDLVAHVRKQVHADAILAGLTDDNESLNNGGTGAAAYADALATYMAFAVDRSANYWSSLTPWGGDFIVQTFGRQALPMVWDFAEGNPFSSSTGNWDGATSWIAKCLEVSVPGRGIASCRQLDATSSVNDLDHQLICTDPPYYDNIGYADLSDFFYIWLRRSVGAIYPDLFATLLTPKSQELIATPIRFGGDRAKAQHFFEDGLAVSFRRMRETQNPDYPLSLFYAFRQAESEKRPAGDGRHPLVASTGWETMLQGLLGSGFAITGTWPVRSERDQGLKTGTNVLASSIVLVCRPRHIEAQLATRAEFLRVLKQELPDALRKLQRGSIAPVDLAQAAIGPGMAVFSRFAKVLEADGQAMRVRTALGLINQALDEVLQKHDSEYDGSTRWAIAWFEQFGMQEGPFGDAESLSKAKNTSFEGMKRDGILVGGGSKVRLLSRDELDANWDPTTDRRLTLWEVTQHLVRQLKEDGDTGAAELARKVGSLGEAAKELAYRLYTICERKKWAQEATGYNDLVAAWPEITRLAGQASMDQPSLGI